MNPLEVRISKKGQMFGVSILVFMTIGIGIMAANDSWPIGPLLLSLASGLLTLLAIKELMDSRPSLVINADGVSMPRTEILIPWSDITGTQRYFTKTKIKMEALSISTKHPERHVPKQRIARWFHYLAFQRNTILVANLKYIDQPVETILEHINFWMEKTKLNPPLDSLTLEVSPETAEPQVEFKLGIVMPIILGLNIAIFLLMWVAGVSPIDPSGEDLLKWGADYGPLTFYGQSWRLFTSTFIHIGFLHLMANMYALSQVGYYLEKLLGRVSFLSLYLASGVIASATSSFLQPEVLSAGASGAIFGLYGGFIPVLLKNRSKISNSMGSNLITSTVIVLIMNFKDVKPGVDVAAHLGGLIAGLFIGFLMVSVGNSKTKGDSAQSLSEQQPRKTIEGVLPYVRNGFIGLLASLLALAAVEVGPKPPTYEHDVLPLLKAFDEVPLLAFEMNNGIADVGKLAELEQEDLPKIRNLSKAIAHLQPGKYGRNKENIETIQRIIALRTDALETYAKALRAGDSKIMENSILKWNSAEGNGSASPEPK